LLQRALGLFSVIVATGCGPSLVRSVDDFGPFIVLAGRLDSTLLQSTTEDPSTYQGAVAWLVLHDDQMGVMLQPTALEPRLFGFAMDIAGPPDLDLVDDFAPAPEQLRLGGTRIALGLLVLHTDAPPSIDGDAMLEWALGTSTDPASVFGAGATPARAAATGHLVAVVQSDRDLTTLLDHPSFVDEAPWCRWTQLEPGLALYRDGGATCDRWRSIPYAEEYQGVDMVALLSTETTAE